MRPPKLLVVLLLLSLACVHDPRPSLATTPPAGDEAQGAAGAAASAPRVPREHMSPAMAEVHDALAEERAKLAVLRAGLARARGTAREAEARRVLAAAKRDAEARLLRIQADHARRQGRLEAAASLEAALAALGAPPAARETASRPAPAREVAR